MADKTTEAELEEIERIRLEKEAAAQPIAPTEPIAQSGLVPEEPFPTSTTPMKSYLSPSYLTGQYERPESVEESLPNKPSMATYSPFGSLVNLHGQSQVEKVDYGSAIKTALTPAWEQKKQREEAMKPTIAPVPVGTIDPNSAFNSPLATAPTAPAQPAPSVFNAGIPTPIETSLTQVSPGIGQIDAPQNPFSTTPDGIAVATPEQSMFQPQIEQNFAQPDLGANPFAPQAPQALSPQANFLEWQKRGKEMTDQQLAQANTLAASMGSTFNPQTGYSRQPFLDAQGQQAATPQSLSDFMAYRDAPQDATIQVQDAQGRFRRQAAPVAGETPEQNLARTNAILPEQARFNQASADREQRIDNRPDFGAAVSDRERRGTGEMSMADAVDLAGGNRKEARAMIIRQRQGRDPITGKSTEVKDNRTPDQIRAQELQNQRTEQIIAKANEPDATPFQKRLGEWEERAKAMLEDGMSQEEVDARRRAFLSGDTFDKWEFDNPTKKKKDKSESEANKAAPTFDTPEARRARLEELRKKAGK